MDVHARLPASTCSGVTLARAVKQDGLVSKQRRRYLSPLEDPDEDPDEDLDGSDGVPYLSLEREGAAHSRALSKLAAIKLLLSTLYVG